MKMAFQKIKKMHFFSTNQSEHMVPEKSNMNSNNDQLTSDSIKSHFTKIRTIFRSPKDPPKSEDALVVRNLKPEIITNNPIVIDTISMQISEWKTRAIPEPSTILTAVDFLVRLQQYAVISEAVSESINIIEILREMITSTARAIAPLSMTDLRKLDLIDTGLTTTMAYWTEGLDISEKNEEEIQSNAYKKKPADRRKPELSTTSDIIDLDPETILFNYIGHGSSDGSASLSVKSTRNIQRELAHAATLKSRIKEDKKFVSYKWPKGWETSDEASTSSLKEVKEQFKEGEFDGNQLDFIDFRDAFVNSVHNNKTLSVQERTIVLLKVCTKKVINKCGIVNTTNFEKYAQMVENLCAQYGDDLDVEDAYTRRLQAFLPLKEQDSEELEEILGITKRYLIASCSNHSKLVMNELIRLMPQRVYTDFCTKYTTKNQRNLKNFDKFLNIVQKSREDKTLLNKDKKRKESQAHINVMVENMDTEKDEEEHFVYFNNTWERKPTNPCPVCQQSHWLFQCRKFRHELTRTQRLTILDEQKRCRKCLAPGHFAKNCRYEKGGCLLACGPDAKHHHTFICAEFDPVNSNSKKEEVNVKLQVVDEVSEATGIQFKTVANCERENNKKNSCTLIQVVLNVKDPNSDRTVKVNALYDTGSNKTTVSDGFIKMWNLPYTEEWLTINGTQNQTKKLLSKVSQLEFLTNSGELMINATVSCVGNPVGDKYEPVDWNAHKHKFDHLKDLNFQEPVAPLDGQEFPILLGTDLSNLMRLDFVSERIPERVGKLRKQFQPVAMKTLLGRTAFGHTDPNLTIEESTEANINLNMFSFLNNYSTNSPNNNDIFQRLKRSDYHKTVEGTDIPDTYVKIEALKEKRLPSFEGEIFDLKNIERNESIYNKQLPNRASNVLLNNTSSEDTLEKMIDAIFNIDKENTAENHSSSEQIEAQEKFQQTFLEMGDGHCRVGILWKKGEPDIINNYQEALKIFKKREKIERRMNPQQKEQFDKAISEWEEDDPPIITEISDREEQFQENRFFVAPDVQMRLCGKC